MASVSSTAMERRFSPFFAKYLRRTASCSARVASRHPPAVCSIVKPPMFASKFRLISSSCAATESLPSSGKASTSSSRFTGADGRLLLHPLVQLGHLVADLVHRPLQLDGLRMVLPVAVERRAEGVDEIEAGDFVHVDFRGVGAGKRDGWALPHAHAQHVQLGE